MTPYINILITSYISAENLLINGNNLTNFIEIIKYLLYDIYLEVMKSVNKITVVLLFFLLTAPLAFSCNGTGDPGDDQNVRTINIAQYPRYAGCDELFDIIFHYTWESNGTIYRFNCTELTLDEIKGKGKKPLNNENFDLLVVGASFDSFYKHGSDPKLKESIKNFISNGGGYIGVCAGTVFATQGYGDSNGIYKKFINKRVLGIADVYINCELDGESQYEFKLGANIGINQGLIPIEKKVLRNISNPIFSQYPFDTINITYGGGPGMYVANASDPNLGKVTPLLIINEELMETKPIHWYQKRLIGWKQGNAVETDIFGQYGYIATTYGEGRVVISTAHPEIRLILNGTINEYIGKSTGYGIKFPFNRAVFSWTGTHMNMSHNWWIHRRAASWIAGVPDEDLPPCNELMVFMDKPQFRFGYQMYGDDVLQTSKSAKKSVAEAGITVIKGSITVEAYAENGDLVEFYIDDVLEYVDYNRPFQWYLDKNLSGIHRLELRAYDEYGSCAYDGSEFLFYNS